MGNLYSDEERPPALKNIASKSITVDYGTTNPCVFLEIWDDGTTLWIDREYRWDSRSEEAQRTGNPQKTDAQYADDMETAGSVAGMITACNTASDSWKEQIDSVYTQILEHGDDKTVETVKEEQSHWVNEQSTALQDIRDSVSENDPLAAITVAESIMVYYRTRAIDLCAVLYDINGTLAFG